MTVHETAHTHIQFMLKVFGIIGMLSDGAEAKELSPYWRQRSTKSAGGPGAAGAGSATASRGTAGGVVSVQSVQYLSGGPGGFAQGTNSPGQF